MTHRGRSSALAVIVLSLAAAGCLTASQESRVQTDLADVRNKIFEMQRDTASMTSRLASIEERLSKTGGEQPVRWADVQALLQTLSDEVRTLGARLDDNTGRMSLLARDMAGAREQYSTLDAKISALLGTRPAPALSAGESGAGSPLAPAQPQTSGNPSAPPPASTGAQASSSSPAAGSTLSPSTLTPPPAGTADPAIKGVGSTAQDEAAQEAAFRGPYSEYTRGNYAVAVAGFDEFLEAHPASALAPSAKYYVGECWFSQQMYQEAADAFGRLATEHPENEKLAAAFLKKGLSLLALKQTAQGVVQLQHVIEAYPRSNEARIAADRLRQLGLRDH